ncbi:MAG: hypothetical protein MZV63_02940 [Marinilabiliales bacterium]|nr:hypothetical protein [Marinilabiliales bacterium]
MIRSASPVSLPQPVAEGMEQHTGITGMSQKAIIPFAIGVSNNRHTVMLKDTFISPAPMP